MNKNLDETLIEYGRVLMAQVAGGEALDTPDWAPQFLHLLGAISPQAASTEPLQSIFTLIDLPGLRAAPAYVRPVALSLAKTPEGEQWTLTPTDRDTALAGDRKALYQTFLSHPAAREHNFERFFHLMRKYASTLPNTYGEAGVSLFEQWKTVAALAQISKDVQKPPDQLGLVGGDIPGIQRTINLVTSKGAAKAMRGRSAFIQLLGQALVQRLLDDLDLCLANVVYDAGGNFLLLTGWSDGMAGTVRGIADEINRLLLAGLDGDQGRFDGFHGDLSVALGATHLPPSALSSAAPRVEVHGRCVSLWQWHEKLAKDAVEQAKDRPFGDLAHQNSQGWQALFDPEVSETADFCAVCRRQKRADEAFLPLDPDAPEDVSVRATAQCPECAGFRDLAESLGKGARLLIDDQQPLAATGWQRALHVVSGKWYSIGDAQSLGDVALALDLDGFPAERVDGFRALAHTTPRTRQGIKPNDVLADASAGGMKRLGVLRMDVDDLGNLIVNGLPTRSMMATAELSASLERFFTGWLDRICARVDQGEGLFYVLFAGGDDLLIVGPWSTMPDLAQAIQEDFTAYTGNHPAIHLSAGIAVVGGKAPLHMAADEAHEALDAAKRLGRGTPQAKNAISFLGLACHWEDFRQVDDLQRRIVALVDGQGLPASLITRLQAIERRYQEDIASQRSQIGQRKAASTNRVVQVYFGPWMWQQAYAIARLANAYERASNQLEQLETNLLDGNIEQLGVSARWAQWLTRKE